MGYDLRFVHLGFTIEKLHNHISIFGFDVAFYGIIIGIGMFLGIQIAMSDAKRRQQNPEVYLDFAIYGIVSAIIGARAYYVLFSWNLYKDDLLQIFNIRAGGLAIYGGVIAASITLIIYAKKTKYGFLSMADTAVLGLIAGQILGRWGNFFNAEAFGGYTNSIFAMQIKKSLVHSYIISQELMDNIVVVNGIEYIQVHPTFLYESLWNLALLMFMLWYRHRKKFDGEVMLIYLGGYGLGRAIIEGLRTDSLMIGNTGIAVSQLLAAVCFVVSSILIIYLRKKRKIGSAEIS